MSSYLYKNRGICFSITSQKERKEKPPPFWGNKEKDKVIYLYLLRKESAEIVRDKIIPMHQTEITIWQHFRKGDKKAFADLFELSSDRLYRYGMKLANDEEMVKDAIQDLFYKLHVNRANLPDVQNPLF